MANVQPGVKQTSGYIVWTQFSVQVTGLSEVEGVTL